MFDFEQNPNYDYFDFETQIDADFRDKANMKAIDLNFEVESITLPTGQQATVQRWIDEHNKVHIKFGLPKGNAGDAGVYIGTEEPTDPNIKVWIDPSAGVNAYSADEIDESFATKEWVEDQDYIGDAPSDDESYARKNGEWVTVESGAGSWDDLSDKPFNTIGSNLKVVSGALTVDTTDDAEEDNTKPITSAGVHTVVGNINALLETI